jgi:hypothetical protein
MLREFMRFLLLEKASGRYLRGHALRWPSCPSKIRAGRLAWRRKLRDSGCARVSIDAAFPLKIEPTIEMDQPSTP